MSDPVPRKTPTRRGRPRGVGRPPEGALPAIRNDILDAAVELLRRGSPESVSLREVARLSKVDPGLVRYYFGDKSGLLTEVASRVLSSIAQEAKAQTGHGMNFRQRVEARARHLLALLSANPSLHQVILNQVIHWQEDAGRGALSQMAQRAIRAAGEMVDAGEQAGEIQGVDPRFLHIAIVGLCESFVSMRPLVNEMFGGRSGPATEQAYLEFIVDLVVRGLAVTPATASGPAQAQAQAAGRSGRRRKPASGLQ